jgi:hypothetical protein
MRHESPESRQPERQEPEQRDLFPETLEIEAIMKEMRNEKEYRNLPKNDPVLKEFAELRRAHRKSGKPSVKYHDHFLD